MTTEKNQRGKRGLISRYTFFFTGKVSVDSVGPRSELARMAELTDRISLISNPSHWTNSTAGAEMPLGAPRTNDRLIRFTSRINMWFVPGEASDGHQWRRGVRNSDTRYHRRGRARGPIRRVCSGRFCVIPHQLKGIKGVRLN